MKNIFKTLLLGITSITLLTSISSCNKSNDDKKDSEENVIDNVYVKKGADIASKKSEYEVLNYNELNSFTKLYDGIFIIFQLKSDAYIDTITFMQEGSEVSNLYYGAGIFNSLTTSYEELEDETYGALEAKDNIEIIVDSNYTKNNYFYFYVKCYCQYSNIKINIAKEKANTKGAFDNYINVSNQKYKLSDAMTNTGLNISNGDYIIVPIRENVTIKNIKLSLKLKIMYYTGFGSGDYIWRNKLEEDNFKEWSGYNKSSNYYGFEYEFNYDLQFNTFISNVKSRNKSDIESLDYLNTYKENSFTDTKFDYDNSKEYMISNLNYTAKVSDYLILDISKTIDAKASYKYIYQVPFGPQEEITSNYNFYDSYWHISISNISNLEIDYE